MTTTGELETPVDKDGTDVGRWSSTSEKLGLSRSPRRGLPPESSAATLLEGARPSASVLTTPRRSPTADARGRISSATVMRRCDERTARSCPTRITARATNSRFAKTTRVQPGAMIAKCMSMEEIHVVGVLRHARWNNSIDFRSGACHSSRRFWHKRSQVTIVRDRDIRRAGPVRAAFLFALQSRRVTPPRWREHRGLKTP